MLHLPQMGRRISIHALREEGDDSTLSVSESAEISIHALREEGDKWSRSGKILTITFLSTPSARRATLEFFYLFG